MSQLRSPKRRSRKLEWRKSLPVPDKLRDAINRAVPVSEPTSPTQASPKAVCSAVTEGHTSLAHSHQAGTPSSSKSSPLRSSREGATSCSASSSPRVPRVKSFSRFRLLSRKKSAGSESWTSAPVTTSPTSRTETQEKISAEVFHSLQPAK